MRSTGRLERSRRSVQRRGPWRCRTAEAARAILVGDRHTFASNAVGAILLEIGSGEDMTRPAPTTMIAVAALLAAIGVGCDSTSESDRSGSAGARGLTGGTGGVGDAESDDTPCRSSTDCEVVGTFCHPAGEPMCGQPCLSRRDCESDEDCGADAVCQEIAWDYCCGGWLEEPLPTLCVPRCAPGDCGDAAECIGGSCEPISCSEGTECPPFTQCLPGDPDADPYGCRRLDCVTDADCSDGYCVNSHCYDALGTCAVPTT
jgi:hypothetical protein